MHSALHQLPRTKGGRAQQFTTNWLGDAGTKQGGMMKGDNGSNSSEIQLININANIVMVRKEVSVLSE